MCSEAYFSVFIKGRREGEFDLWCQSFGNEKRWKEKTLLIFYFTENSVKNRNYFHSAQ